MLGAWQETASPTPGTDNTIVTLSITTKTTPSATATIKPQTQSKAKAQTSLTTSSTSTKAVKTVKPSTAKNTTKMIKPASADNAKPKVADKEETTTAKDKATTKKASPKASTAKPIINIDFDMLRDDTYGGMRVRLQGMVGTPPRLLTGRSFVLLNQEGRGLLVKLSADKKMPPMNTPLAVVGTLKFDTHELPFLSVAKNDSLLTLKKTASSTIREVAWLAPAAEDAWSLASVTGTVVSVSGSTILMSADDTEVSAKIKSGVAYRTARLKKGDTIWVSGVLDMSSEKPALLPRTADEIRLLAHASTKSESVAAAKTTPQGLPGWTPFGAALGAIGAVEGVKKLKSKKKKVATQT